MISIFVTRTMLQALEMMFIPKTFLLDMFFKDTEQSTTKYVDIDIIKGKRRLAPFVSPLSQGKVVDRTGYTTKTFEPPYIKQKTPFTGADILKKQPGEIIYQGNSSPADRAAVQLGKDLLELVNMIIRREEWMASQALTTGKINVVGDGVNAVIDFLMAADHIVTLAGAALWSVDTGDPISNLRTWRQKCSQDSGLVPDVAVLGTDVIKSFLKNANVQKLMDKTKIAIGQINPQQLPSGATYYGYIEGLDIYGYDEWYLDTDDTLKPMVPVDKVIMGSTKARSARHYGAIQDLKATAAVPYFPKSWEEEDPSIRWIMVQSAPLVCPHQIDAFLVAKAV